PPTTPSAFCPRRRRRDSRSGAQTSSDNGLKSPASQRRESEKSRPRYEPGSVDTSCNTQVCVSQGRGGSDDGEGEGSIRWIRATTRGAKTTKRSPPCVIRRLGDCSPLCFAAMRLRSESCSCSTLRCS